MIANFTSKYWFSYYEKNKDDFILNHCTFAIDKKDFDDFITKHLKQLPLYETKITYTVCDGVHEIKHGDFIILKGDYMPVSMRWESYFKKLLHKYPDALIMCRPIK